VKKPLRADGYERNVFINCPFDDGYRSQLDAIAFVVVSCGFVARCSLEIDDGGEVRIEKIFRIIEECRLGLHDLSRTELDPANLLPRFNKPFELGVFLGARRYGKGRQTSKRALILDTEPWRYQKYISDIAGQDIKAHGGDVSRTIGHVRNWLANQLTGTTLPGPDDIVRKYASYVADLPLICKALKLSPSKLTFNDKINTVRIWLTI
jgi:hypothetical protein